MPGGDRTGPFGGGSGTGRRLGYCSGYPYPGYANHPAGFRMGWAGAGRGWHHRFYAAGIPRWVTPAPEQEMADLKAQADILKTQLETIQKRIDELSSKK